MVKIGLNIFGALCFLVLLATGEAISCYVCNSYFDSTCHDVGSDNSTGFLRNCDNEIIFTNHTEVPEKYTICRKMTVSLPKEDRPRVIRSCSWIKHKSDCYYTATIDVKSTVCQCYDTGCNGSSCLKTSLSVIAMAFFLVLALYR